MVKLVRIMCLLKLAGKPVLYQVERVQQRKKATRDSIGNNIVVADASRWVILTETSRNDMSANARARLRRVDRIGLKG